METKMIKIPFDLEKAKRIQAGVEEGKIVRADGYDVRIICWDRKDSDYPLIVLIIKGDREYIFCYTNKGYISSDDAQSSLDLTLLIPETSQYKEGDILKTVDSFFIFKELSGAKCKCYAAYKNGDVYFPSLKADSKDNYWTTQSSIIGYASEEDKQKFIKALKKHNDLTSFKYLKNFFGIQYCFEPLQKVLVRFHDSDTWAASLFSHIRYNENEPFFTVGGITYAQCIPYNKETKHLLGTDNDLDDPL